MLANEMKTGIRDPNPPCEITDTLFQLVDDYQPGNAAAQRLGELDGHIKLCPYCNPEFQKLLELVKANKKPNYILESLKLIGIGMAVQFIVIPIMKNMYKDTLGQ